MDENNNQRRERMSMTMTEKIKHIAKVGQQAEDGSFSEGSSEHQHAAKYMEEFLLSFDNAEGRTNEPEYIEFCAAAINALRDIQVRDYVMGLITTDNVKTINKALSNLASVVPDEYSAPVDTLLALTYYELDDKDAALMILNGVKHDYSLSQLLKRVFVSGWPKESFQQMREELHPKVVKVIFGENN